MDSGRAARLTGLLATGVRRSVGVGLRCWKWGQRAFATVILVMLWLSGWQLETRCYRIHGH